MGGHGGLNILPQKKWNVYNYDNRDIVEKDKKQHAQKVRKEYQTQRKHNVQNKFDVLKGQDSYISKRQENLKQTYQKDSILNQQLKRLAQQNQHVNFFEHQQKIIQNREVIEYQKMKQAEWLKDKDMDYSSKFLGTYNDDSKIPWYAKSKAIEAKSQKKLSKQRYDMQDLTDKIRLQKLEVKKQKYFGTIDFKQKYLIESYQGQVNEVKRQFNDERQRSRQKKYDFIKMREDMKIGNQKQQKTNGSPDYCTSKTIQNKQPQPQYCSKQLQNHRNPEINTLKNKKNDQLEVLRLKRLKRQQKQRKKAQQLRRKLQQSINRN